MARPKYYDEAAKQQETMGNSIAGELKPRNQIEVLEKELACAHEKLRENQDELLTLYRRIHAYDRQERLY